MIGIICHGIENFESQISVSQEKSFAELARQLMAAETSRQFLSLCDNECPIFVLMLLHFVESDIRSNSKR